VNVSYQRAEHMDSAEKNADFYRGKNILISGGCGSIGRAIIDQLLDLEVKVVRIYDNNEYGLFEMEQKYADEDRLRFLIGDVRDKTRLQYALKTVDLVFHAAALKHVPLCEYNPFEAIKTNIIGTQNIIETSIEENVDKFILISTDKAVNPVTTMGATKLLCEKITIAANYYKGDAVTRFACVRFGNVLNSRGSVFQTFREQIQVGGPITVTSDKMRRYIMSISQAANLILKSATLVRGGELFVLKMPVINVRDLAESMVEELAPQYGQDPKKIVIKVIGERTGEKTDEDLLTEYEARYTLDIGDLLIIIPFPEANENYPDLKFDEVIDESLISTEKSRPISKENIKQIIRDVMVEGIV
jgi:FlaA1/EpsC-like NDP-sugar epimerase